MCHRNTNRKSKEHRSEPIAPKIQPKVGYLYIPVIHKSLKHNEETESQLFCLESYTSVEGMYIRFLEQITYTQGIMGGSFCNAKVILFCIQEV